MSEKRRVDELFDLTGHVAVITGAGRGIGEGIAKAMSEAGASVVVAARRTEEIERVASEINDNGGEALAVTTDVTDDKALENLAEAAVDRFGSLSDWVNNAGGSPLRMPIMDLPREEWDKTMALNLTAVYSGSVIAARHMSIPCFGFSVITDLGVPGKIVEVTHEEVQQVASKAEKILTVIIKQMLATI